MSWGKCTRQRTSGATSPGIGAGSHAARLGSFPVEEIYRIIDGQADLSALGPRHMPIWGYEFFGEEPDDELAHREATEKVDFLVRFLESVQRAP